MGDPKCGGSVERVNKSYVCLSVVVQEILFASRKCDKKERLLNCLAGN